MKKITFFLALLAMISLNIGSARGEIATFTYTTADEGGGDTTLSIPSFPISSILFYPETDQGNASTDSNNPGEFTITKDGVSITVSRGIIGKDGDTNYYQVDQNQTLTVAAAKGNIEFVQFICTASENNEYGPGSFTVDGEYEVSYVSGVWTGSAKELVFTATNSPIRITEIRVYNVITCAEAVAICQETGETTTEEAYTIRGYVAGIESAYSEQDGNISFNMVDEAGAEDVLLAFRVKPLVDSDINVTIGDFVEVKGSLVNYKGNTPEVNTGTYFILIPGVGGDTIPSIPGFPDGSIVFYPDTDPGNAATDYSNAGEYTIAKDGVSITVSRGMIGKEGDTNHHYRVYKNQTLTVAASDGNIEYIQFICTASDDNEYGPGGFTVDGEYEVVYVSGIWTGSAEEVVFTATNSQVRMTSIIVYVAKDSTDVENVTANQAPKKVMKDGQLFIIRDDKVYNILGAQVQ